MMPFSSRTRNVAHAAKSGQPNPSSAYYPRAYDRVRGEFQANRMAHRRRPPPRVSLRGRNALGGRADVRGRQGEGEGRSLADRAGDGNLAAVRFHDRLDDVEAEPQACLALLASVLHVAHLVEAIEDLLQVLGRDPRAVVLHRDLQEAWTPLGGDRDPAAVATMLLGVHQQIREHLDHPLAVPQHGRQIPREPLTHADAPLEEPG